MNSPRVVRRTAALVWCSTLAVASAVSAHPSHVSLAEMDWNPSAGTLEVALNVSAVDLERALARTGGRRVDLDAGSQVDKQIRAYLASRFQVRVSDGERPLPIRWIGKEVSVRACWLYFELPVPEAAGRPSLPKLTLRNTMFFELQRDQVNTTNFRHARPPDQPHFDPQRSPQQLAVAPLAPVAVGPTFSVSRRTGGGTVSIFLSRLDCQHTKDGLTYTWY